MNDLIQKAKRTLRNQIKDLDSVIVQNGADFRLDSSDYTSDSEITNFCKDLSNKTGPVIYIISVSSKEIQNQLVSNYLAFHNLNKERRRSEDRYNTSKFNRGASLTLYVGSSKKFKSRVERHLGKGSSRTYALKINKWDSSLDYSLRIQVLNVETTDGISISQSVLELIEQEVWENYQPVFGKKSGQ